MYTVDFKLLTRDKELEDTLGVQATATKKASQQQITSLNQIVQFNSHSSLMSFLSTQC